jgi:hypothetical protein
VPGTFYSCREDEKGEDARGVATCPRRIVSEGHGKKGGCTLRRAGAGPGRTALLLGRNLRRAPGAEGAPWTARRGVVSACAEGHQSRRAEPVESVACAEGREGGARKEEKDRSRPFIEAEAPLHQENHRLKALRAAGSPREREFVINARVHILVVKFYK